MSKLTYFSLSVEKGLRGNIGKAPVYRGEGDKAHAEIMLFLTPNGKAYKGQPSQIVNVHFPQAAFNKLKEFDEGDYIRVGFARIDFAKGVSDKTGADVFYVTVKANRIDMLRKAPEKKASDVFEEAPAAVISETTPDVATVQEQPWT